MSWYTVRPIEKWPWSHRSRQRSRFQASWPSTEALLRREIYQLGGNSVVLQLDVRERDIRIDGELRADARPNSPDVIISFHSSKLGLHLSYPCDAFWSWQDNVRAVALGLEHLRAVERYGITRRGEQYTGWAGLPEGGTTRAQAEAWLAGHGGSLAAALKRYHPDNPETGDRALFDQAMAAKRALEGSAA